MHELCYSKDRRPSLVADRPILSRTGLSALLPKNPRRFHPSEWVSECAKQRPTDQVDAGGKNLMKWALGTRPLRILNSVQNLMFYRWMGFASVIGAYFISTKLKHFKIPFYLWFLFAPLCTVSYALNPRAMYWLILLCTWCVFPLQRLFHQRHYSIWMMKRKHFFNRLISHFFYRRKFIRIRVRCAPLNFFLILNTKVRVLSQKGGSIHMHASIARAF